METLLQPSPSVRLGAALALGLVAVRCGRSSPGYLPFLLGPKTHLEESGALKRGIHAALDVLESRCLALRSPLRCFPVKGVDVLTADIL